MTSSQRDTITIRRAAPGDREALLELLAAAMGTEADEQYRRFYSWKHDQNPYGTSPTWVAELDGDLVGLRTWLRWRFETGGGTLSAVRAVDTATHPAAQGRGVFTRLTTTSAQELTTDGVDYVFNTPNDKSRPGYLKMGWVALGKLPTHVRLTSLGAARRTLQAREAADLWSLPSTVGTSASEAFAAGGAEQWLKYRPPHDGRIRSELTGDVLRWRYGLSELHYRVLTSQDHGCVVFRVRQRGPAREAVVCLVLARDRSDRAVLLRRLTREVDADHLLEIAQHPTLSAGFLPLPGQGPVLTWRALARQDIPALEELSFTLGDAELF